MTNLFEPSSFLSPMGALHACMPSFQWLAEDEQPKTASPTDQVQQASAVMILGRNTLPTLPGHKAGSNRKADDLVLIWQVKSAKKQQRA